MAGGAVVIGGGQAGAEAALALRSAGFDRDITLICAEPGLPYRRPPLSKGYLDYSEDDDELALRTEEVYTEREITLQAEVSVTAIDRAERQLALSDGTNVSYDWLVLATGAEPRRLPLEGADATGVHVLRTISDAQRLRDGLDNARNVVVVGGGFIGLEVAVNARKREAQVAVLEMADRLMGRAVSSELSEYALAFHQEMGTEVLLGEWLTAIHTHDGIVHGVTTSSGRELRCDVLVVGVGVVAETTLAESAGLEVANGVVVDERLRTSDQRIFAIGDCARFPTRFMADSVRLESVQNATDQAVHVAKEIVGGDAGSYVAVPWFWSHQGDLRIQLAGLIDGHDQTLTLGSPGDGQFSVLSFRDGVLIAVDSVNDVRSHLSARKIFASPAPVTFEEATAANFDMKKRALAER